MYRKNIGCWALSSLLIGSSLLYAQEDQASLSELAVQGEAAFAICQSCHDASLNPPKAPPMYGVQRRYNIATFRLWLDKSRQGGLDALLPKQRRDKGESRSIDDDTAEIIALPFLRCVTPFVSPSRVSVINFELRSTTFIDMMESGRSFSHLRRSSL